MRGFVWLGGTALLVGLLAFSPDQVSRGQTEYQRSCAACHGEQGQGGTVPARFEKLAGRNVPAIVGPQQLADFEDGGELFEYVREQMPLQDPGSLTDQTNLDVTAWLLQQHGLAPDGRPLTAESAKGIRLKHEGR